MNDTVMQDRRKEQIASYLTHYFEAVWRHSGMHWEADNAAEIDSLADLIVWQPVDLDAPMAGNGKCVCTQSPERVRKTAAAWGEPFSTVNLNLVLDHRCPKHGEAAQPKLWGRHKTLELVVTPAVWESLGVTYEGDDE